MKHYPRSEINTMDSHFWFNADIEDGDNLSIWVSIGLFNVLFNPIEYSYPEFADDSVAHSTIERFYAQLRDAGSVNFVSMLTKKFPL
jgi:hypothetical protein